MPKRANASLSLPVALSGLLLGASALPAHCEVLLSEQHQHYVLDADRVPAFREQLKHHLAQNSPGAASRTHGLTHSDIEVRYDLLPDGARCVMTNLSVLLTLELTLPRWAPLTETSADMRTQAQRILDGLAAHGMGHRQHTIQAANAIDEALLALPRDTDCEQLQRQARRTVRHHLNRLRVEEGRFDLISNQRHGTIAPPAPTLEPAKRIYRARGWRRTMPASLTAVGQ